MNISINAIWGFIAPCVKFDKISHIEGTCKNQYIQIND